MALEVRLINGVNCPIVVCDVCGKRIEHVKDGNICFSHETDPAPAFVHKECDRPGGVLEGKPSWQSLGEFLIYIMDNLQCGPKELKEVRDWTDEVGSTTFF